MAHKCDFGMTWRPNYWHPFKFWGTPENFQNSFVEGQRRKNWVHSRAMEYITRSERKSVKISLCFEQSTPQIFSRIFLEGVLTDFLRTWDWIWSHRALFPSSNSFKWDESVKMRFVIENTKCPNKPTLHQSCSTIIRNFVIFWGLENEWRLQESQMKYMHF